MPELTCPLGGLTPQLVEVVLSAAAMLWVIAAAPRLEGGARLAAWALTAGVLAVELRRYVLVLRPLHATSFEWDFLCFWVWGHMGSHGVDFYDPASGAAYAAGRSQEFVVDILRTGFWYPPFTMLLVAPLGLVAPARALVAWYVVMGACLLGSVFLLWRLFARGTRALGLAAILAFALVHPGTKHTLAFAQTHSLALLSSLLVLRHRDRPTAGAFAAAALVVKPYLALWLGYLVLRGRFRALGVAAATLAGIVALTAACFGAARFGSYLAENPVGRAPASIHTEAVNQSLNAALLRATSLGSRARDPLVLVTTSFAALCVLTPAAVAAWIHRHQNALLSALLLLTAALVIYPSTLVHYSFMTMPALLFLWSRRASLRAGAPGTALGVVVLTVLTGYESGAFVFWAHVALLTWLLAEALPKARLRFTHPRTAARREPPSPVPAAGSLL